MAYLEQRQFSSSKPLDYAAIADEALPEPDFSQLEWSVIRLARGDGLATIRRPGLLRRVYNFLIGKSGSPRLANDRLEALRRIAVQAWKFGYLIPGQEIADFLTAGFSLDQYGLLVRSTRATATPLLTAEVVH